LEEEMQDTMEEIRTIITESSSSSWFQRNKGMSDSIRTLYTETFSGSPNKTNNFWSRQEKRRRTNSSPE
jgi:uncharacterized protein (DUF924 family)